MPGMRPKIMLAVHQGFSIRYLLQTDIFATLKKHAQVVILCQDGLDEISERFAGSGVEVDIVPAEKGASYCRNGRLQRVLRFIRQYTHAGQVQTAEDHYQIAIKDGGVFKMGLKTRLLHHLLRCMIVAARHVRLLRRAILWFEVRQYVPTAYSDVLQRHRPDLIVTTSLGTFDYDQYLMRAAKRRGIPSAAIILSWDNTTTRGYPGAMPDYAVAWTQAMCDELVSFNDMPRSRVWPEGVAHFDAYYKPDKDFGKAAFKASLGLDPAKRTILVATKSPNAYAFNPNIVKDLAASIESGDLPADCQVLVRVHPLHYKFKDGKPVFGDLLQVYRDLAEKYPSIILNEPEIVSQEISFDMAEEEIVFLSRLIRSTDVLVNMFSTMNIEGAIFDVPLVNVSFEYDEKLYPARMGARFDIMIDWRSNHNQRLLSCNGCRTVWESEDMIGVVRDYLDNPDLDREGRARIVTQEVGPNQGRAGEAIAQRILTFCNPKGV